MALQDHDEMEADVEVRPYEAAKIAGRETVMEGTDMRVTVLTLTEAQ